MTHTSFSYFAPCARGLEPLVVEELRRFGAERVRTAGAGVSFEGSLEVGLRACLWSRMASRVLLRLATVPAASADDLYAAVRDIGWEQHLDTDGTLAIDAVGVNDALRNTQFTAVRVKDAIADRFRDLTGRRPSVDTASPDLLINVRLRGDTAVLALDLSGAPLHRRGYRAAAPQVTAPLKETLAAAVVAFAGWPHIAENGGAFVDPMCGSGTLAIEAALMAADIAPGLTRARWGFSAWLGRDDALWDRLVDDADLRAEVGLDRLPVMRASDVDPAAVAAAQACVAAAGLKGRIEVAQADVSALEPAGHEAGLVAFNPPYGERLGETSELPALYATIARRLAEFGGWTVATVTSDPDIATSLGMDERRTLETFNGRIPVTVRVFGTLGEPEWLQKRLAARAEKAAAAQARRGGAGEAGSSDGAGSAPAPLREIDAGEFANRLRKMARHREKWARRTNVSCYRVYDADLPDFAVAIDVYEGAGADEGRRWVHLAEYAPPAEVDPALADARLTAALSVVSDVLGVARDDVFVKVRERKRGTSQYEVMSRSGAMAVIAENGLRFEVNFSDYLDTGIFLDHRDTRAWLRELAEGKRFLNLFAYTSTASVYAAAGGAASTTSVDLSATYVAWSERNLVRNGFPRGPQHRLVRADVREWLGTAAEAGETYDLIFCDPPTFSTSKRMEGTFDVQRDHVDIITGAAALLAPDGLLVFSCNKRGFLMDVEALAAQGLEAADVTARTIPADFERRPGVHVVWTIRRAAGNA